MDCSPPGSSAHGTPQEGILEWVDVSFSRGSFRPRDRTHISYISALTGRFFTTSTTWEASLVPRSWGLTKEGLCREGACHFQATLCSGPISLDCGWQEENMSWAQVSPSSNLCYQLPHVPTPQWGCWQKMGWPLGCPAHPIPAGGSLHHRFQKSRRRPSFTLKGLPPFKGAQLTFYLWR